MELKVQVSAAEPRAWQGGYNYTTCFLPRSKREIQSVKVYIGIFDMGHISEIMVYKTETKIWK